MRLWYSRSLCWNNVCWNNVYVGIFACWKNVCWKICMFKYSMSIYTVLWLIECWITCMMKSCMLKNLHVHFNVCRKNCTVKNLQVEPLLFLSPPVFNTFHTSKLRIYGDKKVVMLREISFHTCPFVGSVENFVYQTNNLRNS